MDTNSEIAILRLWQQQEREERLMGIDEIRANAERLDTRSRRWRSFTVLLFVLLVIAEARQVWMQQATIERVGDSLTIAALVYVAYRFRRQRTAAPPLALGRTNCVEFYRTELARQHDLSNDSWGYLLPFVPGVALAVFGRGLGERPVGETLAIVIFAVALFLGIAGWNAYTARKLQRQMHALDAGS
jgi:hypothetical protein